MFWIFLALQDINRNSVNYCVMFQSPRRGECEGVAGELCECGGRPPRTGLQSGHGKGKEKLSLAK